MKNSDLQEKLNKIFPELEDYPDINLLIHKDGVLMQYDKETETINNLSDNYSISKSSSLFF